MVQLPRRGECKSPPFRPHVSLHTPSQGCTSYKSGVRRIEGELIGLIDKKDQDLGLMCASTPLIWNYITYTSPTHCEERVSESRVHHVVRKANSSHDSTLTECLECGTCPTTVACNLLHPVRKILTHPVVPWHCTLDLLTLKPPRLDLPLYIARHPRVPLADQNDFLARRNCRA